MTGVLIAVAVLLVVLAVVYFTTTAANLPAFFPGHLKGSAHHHVKHGLACITLAVVALIGAWFTTAPARETAH
jgi:hypothetical protein